MQKLRDRKGGNDSTPLQGGMAGLLWGARWMFFFLCFFGTPEGSVLLNAWSFFGGAVENHNGSTQMISGFLLAGYLMLFGALAGAENARWANGLRRNFPRPGISIVVAGRRHVRRR